MAPRKRPGSVRIVALLGLLVGFALLAQLRVEVPDGPPPPARAPDVAVKPPVVPPPPRPTPRPRPRAAPAPLPSLADGPAEDTGDAAALTGEVEFVVDGDGWPMPVDCAVRGVVDRGEGFVVLDVEPGPCVARGMRRDGMLRAMGEEVVVEVAAGERVTVELPMPRGRTGGIGVAFRPSDDGVRVLRVVPGTPAWDAGLEAGDLIVEVDGVATSELSSDEFVSIMTGEEGTDVSFVVGFDADTGWTEEVVDVTRAFLSG